MKVTVNCKTDGDLVLLMIDGYIMTILTNDFTKLYRVNYRSISKEALIYDNPHLDREEFNDNMITKLKTLYKSSNEISVSYDCVEILDTATLLKTYIIESELDTYSILFDKVLILVPKSLPNDLDEIRKIIKNINNFDLPGRTLYLFFFWLSVNGLAFTAKSEWYPRYSSVNIEELAQSMI